MRWKKKDRKMILLTLMEEEYIYQKTDLDMMASSNKEKGMGMDVKFEMIFIQISNGFFKADGKMIGEYQNTLWFNNGAFNIT